MKKLLFTFLTLITFVLNLYSQEVIRNLGFEQIGPNGQILSWQAGNTKQQFQIKLDTVVFHSGKVSFSVESIPNAGTDLGVAGAESIIFSPIFKSKRTVKVSAYIKTENITEGVAGLAIRLNGKNNIIAQTDTGNDSKSGTNDWSLIEVELPLTPEVLSVNFAIQVAGKGKVWFDDVQISVDDKTIASSKYEDQMNLHN